LNFFPHWPSASAGFALGLGLIAAIGAQNAFVLRQGLKGEHVALVVAICALSDAALIAAGVAGAGALSGESAWIGQALRWGGAAFLALYGLRSLRAAWRGGQSALVADVGGGHAPAGAVAAACLAFTWLNPHVYLDTLALVGAVSARAASPRSFGAGAMTASLVFFSALGFGARLLRPVFATPAAWRALDAGVGVIMLALAAGLARG
jgi:L-lysine exporter family protein LysE/ArgO